MKIVGFVKIKQDADFSKSIWKDYNLNGRILPVLEMCNIDGVMVYVENSSVNKYIPSSAIESIFECEIVSDFILPPKLSEFEKTSYIAKISKCNLPYYSQEAKDRIIKDSLLNGKFDDSILFD